MSKTPIEFIFLTFGERTHYHSQLIYSMISLVAHSPLERPYHFTIVTDKPEFYQWLDGDLFTVVQVEESILSEWRGPFDFFWRIKIEAILYVAKKNSEHHCNAVHLRVSGFFIFSISLRSRLNCSRECSFPSPFQY